LIKDGVDISLMEEGEQRAKRLGEFRNRPTEWIWKEDKGSVLVYRGDVFMEENSRFGVDVSGVEWRLASASEQSEVEDTGTLG
jgi:hypothetical protein